MKAHLVKVLGMEQHDGYPKDVHMRHLYKFPYLTETEVLESYRSFFKMKSYFRFCLVRNPWSRLVSCYKNRILVDSNKDTGAKSTLYKCSPEFKNDMSFEAFIDVVCKIPDSKADQHFRSQLFELTNRRGELLVNYIGHLENMGEALTEITKHSGISFSDFPLLNTTVKKKSYRDFYTPAIVEKVRKRFAPDIEFFNYEFEQEAPTKSIGLVDEAFLKRLSKSEYLSPFVEQKKDLPEEQKIELPKESVLDSVKNFLNIS